MEYLTHLLVLAAIYGILALSLDLLMGHTGMVSVAHAGFFGIGAYASAVLATRHQAPFTVGLLAGIGVAAAVACLAAGALVRFRDDYFAIATLGLQMLFVSVFTNWIPVTGGSLGIRAVPRPRLLGWTVSSAREFLLLASALLLAALLANAWIARCSWGRVLHAIRDDPAFVASLGKNVSGYRTAAVVVAAVPAAIAGSVFAHYVTYVDAGSFTAAESVLVVSMVIVGGSGTPWGPVAGAALLVILPESLRFVGFEGTEAASLRRLIYGTLLLLVLRFRPHGLLGAPAR